MFTMPEGSDEMSSPIEALSQRAPQHTPSLDEDAKGALNGHAVGALVEVVIIQGGVVVGRCDHRGREGEGSVAVEEEGSRQLPILHAHAELCGAPGSDVASWDADLTQR